MNSRESLAAAKRLAQIIAAGGDVKSFLWGIVEKYSPEDAVLVHDEAFAVLRLEMGFSGYTIRQADEDLAGILPLCGPRFIAARRAMGSSLVRAFDAYYS